MIGFSKLLAVVYLACTAFASGEKETATEPLTLSITLPITVPLTVEPGQDFHQAAESFCQKNGIGAHFVDTIADGLKTRWQEIRKSNPKSQCEKWKNDYEVIPLHSWGNLPEVLRAEWNDLDCNAFLPSPAAKPLINIPVQVHNNLVYLELYNENQDVDIVVDRFCLDNGISKELNGEALRNALRTALVQYRKDALPEQNDTPAQPAQHELKEQQIESPEGRGQYLFSVPVNIDNNKVYLRVFEGDEMALLIKNFCAEYDIEEARYGDALRNAVISSLEKLQKIYKDELEDRLKAQNKEEQAPDAVPEATEEQTEETQQTTAAAKKPKTPIFSVPISIDGKSTSVDLYNGDHVGNTISKFCEEHNLSPDIYSKALTDAVLDRVRDLLQTDGNPIKATAKQ